ncbi:Type IV secretory pathway, VirB4 components [Serratia quinivorans]|uniref:conjugative transfer ATPase n=1 Tax=Serratia TaxID=613 RepID=UPI002178DCFB|nr:MULTISPECIES: conjugative transfer ATPase [Serratia]CAI0834767.1 Type IV secretory pathway, VirB4 components [Serratia quinivorans]CAI1031492.1 Type IV secretory pathway, VirB4 components [Serratia quinivorans]CAI1036129.1 Type IV secretory pathway, VirB4 components [Serratia quinivorans]CAI1051494.1 Type IV secretory pathway, VirB4 components [Serratia quinivorans]CAI1126589.1 Type IV secretory pathway, VirB4 components [Serratia entomophila]
MRFSLFDKKRLTRKTPVVPATGDQDSVIATEDGVPRSVDGREPLRRPGKMTVKDEKQVYHANPSIVDYLPWAEFLDREQCILLDDGVSVGAVFDITPVATEGRTDDRLEQMRDTVEDALQDSFDEHDENPWVVQFFCQDENNVEAYIDRLRNYVKPHAQGSAFTEDWLKETERHMRGIARPEGLFKDTLITDQPWRGQQRRTRMVVYRWIGKGNHDPMPPIAMLNQTCERVTGALAGAGVICVRQNGAQVHDWLLRHFNPNPEWVEKETLYRDAAYFDSRDTPEGAMPVQNDFAETLLFTPPVSDPEQGVWWFDNQAHCAIPVEKLRRPPEPGTITGEMKRGEKKINALMDLFPEGTMLCMTIVVQPQDTLENDFNKLSKNAVGENTESGRVRQDVAQVKEYLGNRHKLYRAGITFLLRAGDLTTLNHKRVDLTNVLLGAGLQPVRPEFDVAPLNTYLRVLPMCFNPETDKKHWYTRLTWVQHLAGLLPVTGRETGTGNPGMSFFNRGGDTLTVDPLNKHDRSQNAHMLYFGPTGAGKSATLCATLSQLMAIHRPRLFIAEAGNSFGLLADYFESQGLSVNKVSIKPGSGVSLPPFSYAHKLVEDALTTLALDENDLPDIDADDDDDDDKRDYLGEMEISARMMITGGDAKEEHELKRADRAMIREALLMAARQTYDEGRQMLPADLQKALYTLSKDEGSDIRNEQRRAKAAEMAESLGMFTQAGSFEAELFNREGSLWPEADVTLIDLGHLAREGYEAQMALTMVSLTNTINNIAERDQYSERDIVFAVDEAHIVTVNPLLAPYMTKIVKMWRKLGAWLWLATQNLKDFPDIAEKMLNMAEWWVCLTMPPEEVNDIARFKALTEEQKAVLLSASKLSGCYTEGVVLSKKLEALFRAVPPSLYLALGMTEKEEKAERRALMQEFGCSELEAARKVAQKLDRLRGLVANEEARAA